MTQKYRLALILVIVLLVACSVMACLGGLVVGGVVTAARAHFSPRTMHRMEDDDYTTPGPVPRRPQQWRERVRITALVTKVYEGSPADEAGIKAGDRILSIDDQQIESGTDLRDLLAKYEPGDIVEMSIRRGARERDIQIKLGRNPQERDAPYLGLEYRLAPLAAE
jgi:S1-C subfamily serine protease